MNLGSDLVIYFVSSIKHNQIVYQTQWQAILANAHVKDKRVQSDKVLFFVVGKILAN